MSKEQNKNSFNNISLHKSKTNYKSLCLRRDRELCSEVNMRYNRIYSNVIPLGNPCPLENILIPWLSAPSLIKRVMDDAKNHLYNLHLV